jgi:hypothetical protein
MEVDNPLTAVAGAGGAAAAPAAAASTTAASTTTARTTATRTTATSTTATSTGTTKDGHNGAAVDRSNRLHAMKELQKQKRSSTSSHRESHGGGHHGSNSKSFEPPPAQPTQLTPELRRASTRSTSRKNDGITGGSIGTIAPLEVTHTTGEPTPTGGAGKKRKNKTRPSSKSRRRATATPGLSKQALKSAVSLGQRAFSNLATQASQQNMSVAIEQSNMATDMSPRIVQRHLPHTGSMTSRQSGAEGITMTSYQMPGFGPGGRGVGSDANHVFRAKAQYRVHALYLTFIGDSSIHEFERMYQRHHDIERYPSIKRFVTLLTLIFIAYLAQTYMNHPGQWDYHFFVVLLTGFSLLGLLMLHYKSGEMVIPRNLQKHSRLQRFMAFSIFVVCLMHMLRALQNHKDIGYAWTMSYLPCLYISTMATVIGLRFVYFFPAAIAILSVHLILVYWIRPTYRGDQLGIIERVASTLWMYDVVTLVIFTYVSRNLEYASRRAFVQLRTLMDVNIDVRMDSDSRMIEGMFQSSAAKKVLRAIGGTDWVIRWQDLELGEKFAAG